jgi:hypothetical protein
MSCRQLVLFAFLGVLLQAASVYGKKGCSSDPPLVVIALSDDCPFGYMDSSEVISVMVPSGVGGASCSQTADPSSGVSQVSNGEAQAGSPPTGNATISDVSSGASSGSSTLQPAGPAGVPGQVGTDGTITPAVEKGASTAGQQSSDASTLSLLTPLVVSLLPVSIKFSL